MAVIKMNFLSQTLSMQTNVTICLPSFSFADLMQGREDVYVPGMKYQVLWLLHGFSGDDSDYVNFSNIVRYADDHKLAVVMPPAFNAGYTDQPGERAAKYFTFVAEELPKLCRAFFPFSDAREDNFVAGLSMGGGGTFKLAMAHPENYAAAICMSGAGMDPSKPHPQFGEQVDDGIEPWSLAAKNVADGKPLPKMYLTCGGNDAMALVSVKDTHDYLTGLGYDSTYVEIPGYGHEWDFWDLTLRNTIRDWLPIRHSVIYPEK
ncbi:MAG: hypothetical protein IKS29_00990 [Oscillospiraceae bacterium]|nr:hypothetical protein [Oscillospiraceae bacterium]